MSGVDAIIHVASPLPDTASPEVILEVRGAHAGIGVLNFSNLVNTTLFRKLSLVRPASLMPLSPAA
jgi:hypothetical protein